MTRPISPEDAAFARSLVIDEDATLIAFNKPSGLAVQGGSGVTRSLEDLLGAFAKSNGKHPRLVHRLDRDTSGVIIAARTKPRRRSIPGLRNRERTRPISPLPAAARPRRRRRDRTRAQEVIA